MTTSMGRLLHQQWTNTPQSKLSLLNPHATTATALSGIHGRKSLSNEPAIGGGKGGFSDRVRVRLIQGYKAIDLQAGSFRVEIDRT